MPRLFLSECRPGDAVEDVFILANKQLSTTSSGKPFIKAFVSDRTAQVTARMWNAGRDIFEALPDNGFVRIAGRCENYQGNLQFIIERVWPAKEGTYAIEDLLPRTKRDIAQMYARVRELCATVRNRHVRALAEAYLADEPLMRDFQRSPAAMSFHHAYVGGLLEHTLNAMEVADAVVRFYPGLNRDLVLVGVFVHDLAKTWELNYETAFGYTDGGQLVGHIVKGAMWLEEKARQASAALGEAIPRDVIDVLQHIVLSHHGTPEFGAVKPPSTPEAIAVHILENMDAKLMMALTHTRDVAESAEGNWTEYLKAFGGRLYRPDVAPEEPALPAMPLPPADAVAAPSVEEARKPPATVKMQISNPLFETGRQKK